MKPDGGLKKIAVDCLYEGMVVKDDIYDFNAKCLLLPSGKVLDAEVIEKLKQVNKRQRCI